MYASQAAKSVRVITPSESTKLCCDFAVYITAIIMMLITILLMIEDRCNTSFAKQMLAMYIYNLF